MKYIFALVLMLFATSFTHGSWSQRCLQEEATDYLDAMNYDKRIAKLLSGGEAEEITVISSSEPLDEESSEEDNVETRAVTSAKFVTVTYNIGTRTAKAEEDYTKEIYPNFHANARAPLIQKTLDYLFAHLPQIDLFHIQGAKIFTNNVGITTIDSLSPLVEYFENKGYKALISSYKNIKETGNAFCYITAYNPQKMTVTGSELRLFTKNANELEERWNKKNAEIIEHNLGSYWERGAFINRFIYQDKILASINVSLSPTSPARVNACKKLLEFIDDEIKTSDNPTLVVIAGDFNTFNESKDSKRQIDILTSEKNIDGSPCLQWQTSKLKFSDGQPANFTFVPFPFDCVLRSKPINKAHKIFKLPHEKRKEGINKLYREKCQATGGKLDQIFTYGFKGPATGATAYLIGLLEAEAQAISPPNKDDIVSPSEV